MVIGARHLQNAERVAAELRHTSNTAIACVTLDHRDAAFESALHRLKPAVVVHAAGPFQDQDYAVAEACLVAGINYVDLADTRAFVSNFETLDAKAKAAGVTLISGASTLPGLSSAVVEHLHPRFATVERIETTIVPGNQTPRGLSTVQAVLSYCGRRFNWLRNGRWEPVHGWQDIRTQHYPSLGKRRLGTCDVPDLTLFAKRYPELHTLTFHAGLARKMHQ